MSEIIRQRLIELECEGNLRRIPRTSLDHSIVDLSSNDYLGLAARGDLREAFLNDTRNYLPFTSSASRLLSSHQDIYTSLESRIAKAYGGGRAALLFNSGYHANTGIIPALAFSDTVILADRLVHASIIDGIKLSGKPFFRFKHNSVEDLEKRLKEIKTAGKRALIIVESVYSMDGDFSPLEKVAEVKNTLSPDSVLYVDEAHAVGALGNEGLGLAKDIQGVDVIVGTFGKALASDGAFAVISAEIREWLVNNCRSLIFSTMLSPIQVGWSDFIFEKMLGMSRERNILREKSARLSSLLSKFKGLDTGTISHIQPLIIGDSKKALECSSKLREYGFNVLPIRRPTVPPGTERLRFSLGASLPWEIFAPLETALSSILKP